MDNYKGQGAKIRERLHWIKERSRGPKFFFKYINYKHEKERSEAISDEYNLHTDVVEISMVFHKFYENLFKEGKNWTNVQQTLEDIVKEFIPNKIDPIYSLYLDHVLSLEDIECAIFSIKPYKSTSYDGFLIEFYQTMWPQTKDEFYKLYLEAFHKGSLGPNINRGLNQVGS